MMTEKIASAANEFMGAVTAACELIRTPSDRQAFADALIALQGGDMIESMIMSTVLVQGAGWDRTVWGSIVDSIDLGLVEESDVTRRNLHESLESFVRDVTMTTDAIDPSNPIAPGDPHDNRTVGDILRALTTVNHPDGWKSTGEAMVMPPGDVGRNTVFAVTYDTPYGPRALDGDGRRYIIVDCGVGQPTFSYYDHNLPATHGTCPECLAVGPVGNGCCQGFWMVNDHVAVSCETPVDGSK